MPVLLRSPLGEADPVPESAAATAAVDQSKTNSPKNKSAAPRIGFARAPRARVWATMSNAAPGYRLHDAEIAYPCFR
jgi:hypothetical protein